MYLRDQRHQHQADNFQTFSIELRMFIKLIVTKTKTKFFQHCTITKLEL